ncbi:MAG: S9 family peptidase [Flavobacteriales bacterium]|nr:S9 family peptidase [Flavobacteriales bacterium]
MKLFNALAPALALSILLTSCTENKMEKTKEKIEAPVAKKVAKELTQHGDVRIDNYYWLRDMDRKDPEIIKYLEDENAYTKAKMKHTEKFQEELFEEITGRIDQTDESVPVKFNGYWYYTRYEEGKEYPLHCRKKESLEAEEEIMLNVPEMAEGFEYYAVSGRSVSPDNKWIAYGVDTLSRRIYTIFFKNLETGEIMESSVPNTTGGCTWAADNETVFYSVKDDALRSYKIFKHTKGQDASNDIEVYHEDDETFSTFVYKTKSRKYLVIGSFSTLSTEYRFLDAKDPHGEFKIVLPREEKHEYGIAHYGDDFYISTNWKAKNFRLMKTSVNKTAKENWTEVIPHRDDVLLESIEIFKDFLVIDERKGGLTNIRIMPWNNKAGEYFLPFNDPTYLASIGANPEFDTEVLRYSYSSMTTPMTTYDFNMVSKDLELKKRQKVIGGHEPSEYVSERLMVKVRDGAEVPVSIVYKKGFKKDGSQPVLLYAYGSYGSSMEAYFSSTRLSLLDRGFAFAIAHIRGGQEMGRHWYEDGKLLKKKNTFTDFIDCGDYLLENGYSGKDQLYAMGGSAGGLLMGAVTNMRPDLWNGVVAAVPFVDVVTTMLDESIPLTTGEWDEWGNPITSKEYYDYMLSYSPYDNVEAKPYPNMLVTTGLHDSQVQYWEPAKWVAKMRDMKTDDNLLLLHTNMGAGHGGASGRFQRYKEVALEYAFLFDLEGINK